MENDGQHNHPGEEELDPTANVVRFPRDWFGPPEELVPFGPRAAGEARGPAGSPETPLDAAPPTPVRAEDFWGEGSASIQDAMQGPEVVVEGARQCGEPPPPRRHRLLVKRGRPLVVAGMGLAVCMAAASVLGSVWPAGVRGPQSARESAGLSPAVIGPAAPPVLSPSTPAQAKTRHARRTIREHRGRGRQSGSLAPAGTGARTSSTSAAATPAATAQSTPSVAASSSSSPGTASSAATQASSDSGGGGNAQSAGPAGPGAPFGPGHLG